MPNQISDLPTPKNFGLDFNYSSWPANSDVTFCNVPWNNDYRDVVRFSNQTALNTYLDTTSGKTVKMRELTNIHWGQPIDLDIPFTEALEYNYIKVTNPAVPMAGIAAKSYYYFIQNVQFIAGNNTRIFVQVDAWQTFIYTTTFGNCYVEKGHIGIANINSFSNYGRDYLTVPEGMDVGGEYQVIDQYSRAIGSAGYYPIEHTYDIMIVSTVSLESDFGTVDDPKFESARGSTMEGIASGAEIYFVDSGANFKKLMEILSDHPWISQGIISIQAVPETRLYSVPTQAFRIYAGSENFVDVRKPWNPGTASPHSMKLTNGMKVAWRDAILANKIPVRYRGLKKLLTFPYCVLELTTNTGTPIVMKPESWYNANADVVESISYSPSGARAVFYPRRYNAAPNGVAPLDYPNGTYNDGGEFLDMSTFIGNFPQVPLVNNGYMSFMASNKNSINYQHSNADWSQQKALTAAQLAQENVAKGIAASGDINSISNRAGMSGTAIQNEAMTKQAILGAVSGTVMGTINGGPGGFVNGVGSALTNGISTAISMDANNQQMGVSVGSSSASNARGNQLASDVSDSNKGYADNVAKGDYAQAIAGINARVQDATMIQPTTSGQIGGDSYLLSSYKWGYDLKVKMLGGAALASIGEYFLRYGYNISRFMKLPANLMVMSKFTYWKLSETYIVSSKCPEEFRQTLRGIMEKGVTVWANPNDIGIIDIADNQPLAGVSY